MSDRLTRVESLLHAALARPQGEREAFLDAACAGDAELRREVASLVAHASEAGSFLETPVAVVARPLVGRQLGPYRIDARIGAGGMGEVYRARDTKLGRDVAIKILSGGMSWDPDRLARLSREARTLAALNHPHIGAIYGLEESDGLRGLVLELVDGETLAERLARGPLAIADALSIASQIASALEAAHAKGIVHRDLKPANIKITSAGSVKVLDFGLAKADASESEATTLATREGTVMGTPAYMSPEQARGEAVGEQTDIWAFGCVLYEMLTGRRAFGGATASDAIAAVLKTEPDLATLPLSTPDGVRGVLRRCLQKERDHRTRNAGDIRLALEDALSPASAATTTGRRRTPWGLVAASLAAALAALVGWEILGRPDTTRPPVARLEIVPPDDYPFDTNTSTAPLAISPDGTRIAFVSGNNSSGGPLLVRAVSDLAVNRVLTGRFRDPVFSPDGQWIVCYGDGGIVKAPVAGGTRVVLVPDAFYRGASWADDHTIVFGTIDKGLMRVSDGGGAPAALTTPDTATGELAHLYPFVLPHGRGILFTIVSTGGTRVAVFDPKDGSRTVVLPGAVKAEYVDPGYLVYVANGTLAAVRFDLGRLRTIGEPMILANDVATGLVAGAYFATSRSGTVAYVPAALIAGEPRTLVWVDRHGRETPVGVPDRPYETVSMSPDGKRVAVTLREGLQRVWTFDIPGSNLAPITDDRSSNWTPIWTPDSRELVFQSNRDGSRTLYRQSIAGGAPTRLVRLNALTEWLVPGSISRDGLIYGNLFTNRGWRLFVLALSGSDGPRRLLPDAADEVDNFPAVSRDGRFVAYVWNTVSGSRVYVRPLPDATRDRWPVSQDVGRGPRWSRDGRELFFLDGSGRLMGARVDTTGPVFHSEPAVTILQRPYMSSAEGFLQFDVSPDGRFLMMKATGSRAPTARIVMLLNALGRP